MAKTTKLMKMPPKPNEVQVSYNFYATLLDSFQDYLNTDSDYDTFMCRGEEPSCSIEEYEQKRLQEFLDKLNRVPLVSEAADKGTAFNEILDTLVKGEVQSEKCPFTTEQGDHFTRCQYNGWSFAFDNSLIDEFYDYYRECVPQVYTDALIDTRYGWVRLYGYIDYLGPFCIHDLKTTKYYKAFHFRDHWQHVVYPYCLLARGNKAMDFEYNITDFRNTYTEKYSFAPDTDIPRLREHCERLIEFIVTYKHVINQPKLFNE